jgi:phage terminase large subunit
VAKVALTPVYQKLEASYVTALFNVFVLEGGSRSSKTYSIIQFLIKWAIEHQGKSNRIGVFRLKATWATATVLHDFLEVLRDYGLYDKNRHNKSTGAGIYTLFTTEFWFMGLDDEQRVHGFKSDVVWINEAVEASFDDYAQLMQRCSGFAILDYNPSYDEHWIYDRLCKRSETAYIHSTMLDNPLIPDNAKKTILSYEPTSENIASGTADKWKWEVYGLGRRATLEGLIFPNREICKEIPHWVKTEGYGMDFGYSNDVTAIVHCGVFDKNLYIDELCYKTHMLSSDIINELKGFRKMKIISESADPRLIDEIALSGFYIVPVIKNDGSVKAGIDAMQGYKLFITERSVNAIREFRNYTWQFDEKAGKFINIPVKGNDHCIDASRYWVYGELLGRVKNAKRVDKEDVYVDIF